MAKKKTLWSISRKSVIFKWIVSYLVIMVIPVLLGAAILIKSQEIVIRVYTAMNKSIHQQTGKIISTLISEIDMLRTQLINNNDLVNFINLKTEDTSRNWYRLVDIMNQLANYKLIYKNTEFYVYIKNIDSVMTPGGLYTNEI